MEWLHRIWGRVIGLAFVGPAIALAAIGKLPKRLQKQTALISVLIGCQGLLGWYMVKSGLDKDHIEERPVSVPRVSQYRLAAHLGSAFLIYSLMLATGLEVLYGKGKTTVVTKGLLRFTQAAKVTTGLIFVTALSGAFVAGLDAGLIYNEFPYMGEGFIPSDLWGLSKLKDGIPWYKNFLENPVTAQFDHRVLAMTTLTAVGGLWIAAMRVALPIGSRVAVHCMLGMTVVQVSLGIFTLIYFVPVPLAATHQAGSLTLLSIALWTLHTLKRVR